MVACGILAAGAGLASQGAQSTYSPRLGPFERLNDSRPLLSPQGDGFEAHGVFNPAVVRDGDRVVMLYRAQDKHGISRLGYATSTDGVTFTREAAPVLGPEAEYERGGGVEDPRLVKIDGLYYLTYTAYNGKDAQLALATSSDLRQWDRKGVILPAYKGRWNVNWTKAGAILPSESAGGTGCITWPMPRTPAIKPASPTRPTWSRGPRRSIGRCCHDVLAGSIRESSNLAHRPS